MASDDLTIEILKGIRDGVRDISVRVDETNARLDQTNARLDEAIVRLDHNSDRLDRLERRQAETEVRLSTELVAVVGAIHEVRDLLRDDQQLRQRVDDHEHRLLRLESAAPPTS